MEKLAWKISREEDTEKDVSDFAAMIHCSGAF